jgi:hypothetical protein
MPFLLFAFDLCLDLVIRFPFIKLKLHALTGVESFPSLRRGENLAEAEFSSLSIPTLTGGEFREGGLNGLHTSFAQSRMILIGADQLTIVPASLTLLAFCILNADRNGDLHIDT